MVIRAFFARSKSGTLKKKSLSKNFCISYNNQLKLPNIIRKITERIKFILESVRQTSMVGVPQFQLRP